MKEESSHIRNRGIASSSLLGRLGGVMLLLLLCLASCSHDDEGITSPSVVPATTQLQLSFGGASTYAEATPAEKELESIAIFVQVGASDVFSSHLITQADLVGKTATITVPENDLSSSARIIVIANYKDYISDSELKAARTLSDIQSLRTPDIATMPNTPLLMYYTESFANLQTHLQTYGKVTVNLKRMAARIDVIGNDTENFKLYSAQVTNSKPATYLLPYNTTTNIAAIAPLVDFTPSTTVINTENDKRITLYTYECGESDLPVVQVVYQSVEDPSLKFTRPYPITTQLGNPITSIVRNTYYVVHTTPPPVAVLDIDDDGWDEEDDIWFAVP